MDLPDSADVIRNLQMQIADQALRLATAEAMIARTLNERDVLAARLADVQDELRHRDRADDVPEPVVAGE